MVPAVVGTGAEETPRRRWTRLVRGSGLGRLYGIVVVCGGCRTAAVAVPRKEKKMLRTLWGSLQALFAVFSLGADSDAPLSADPDLGHTIDPDG
jgi:hypothetical protein